MINFKDILNNYNVEVTLKTVNIKKYTAPAINNKEILRYAGIISKENADLSNIHNLIDECLYELKDKLSYKVCYTKLPITFYDDYIDLTFTKTNSNNLKTNLANCNNIILFAATIGIELDRLINKHSIISPSKALIMQAIGVERIESLCNQFNEEIRITESNNGNQLAPRFSPGYGDLPLDLQKDIFNTLNCQKNIGLTLNQSLLMSPSKSVTAIIGIKP